MSDHEIMEIGCVQRVIIQCLHSKPEYMSAEQNIGFATCPSQRSHPWHQVQEVAGDFDADAEALEIQETSRGIPPITLPVIISYKWSYRF